MALWPVALPRAGYGTYALTDFNNAMRRLDDAFPLYTNNIKDGVVGLYGAHLYGSIDFARYESFHFRLQNYGTGGWPNYPHPKPGQEFFNTLTKRGYIYGGDDSKWLETTTDGSALAQPYVVVTQYSSALPQCQPLGTNVIMAGNRSVQPTAAVAGRVYVVSDEYKVERDDGNGWRTISTYDATKLVTPLTTFSPSTFLRSRDGGKFSYSGLIRADDTNNTHSLVYAEGVMWKPGVDNTQAWRFTKADGTAFITLNTVSLNLDASTATAQLLRLGVGAAADATNTLTVSANDGLFRIVPSGTTFCILSGYKDNSIGTGSTSCIIACGGTDGFLQTIGTNAYLSIIGGGYDNHIGNDSYASTISGGAHHNVSGAASHCTIGGGSTHTVSGSYGGVFAGLSNTASGTYSFVGSGNANTASGLNSTVPGGSGCTASGDYSFAAGRKAAASGTGAFCFADSTDAVYTNSTNNSLSARFAGGYALTGGPVNLGSTTLAAAGQLDFAAGVTGAAQLFYDQSAAQLIVKSSGASSNLILDGDGAPNYIYITNTNAGTANTYWGVRNNIAYTRALTGSGTQTIYGMSFSVGQSANHNTSGILHVCGILASPTISGAITSVSVASKLCGIVVDPIFSGTGTYPIQRGIEVQRDVSNASGTITTSSGVWILDPVVTGAITNNYGIYVAAQTAGGTLNRAIYTAGGIVELLNGGTENLRLSYSAAVYASHAVDSSGNLLIHTTGGLTEIDHNLSVNVAASANYALYLGGTRTTATAIGVRSEYTGSYAPTGADAAYAYGLDSRPTYSGAANTAGGVYVAALYGVATWTGNITAAAATSSARGAYLKAYFTGTGTLPLMYGVQVERQSANAGGGNTITDSYGLYVADHVLGGDDHLTNNYGIYIEDQTVGGTLNYALYIAGGKSRFIGDIELYADTAELFFGGGADAKVYYDGTDMKIATNLVAVSNLSVTTGADRSLILENGILALKEITTPTAVADYGRLYTKADNKLYFQDGAGTEHEVAYV